MSVRGVWVISDNGTQLCLFARRFPTVERRAKLCADYCPLPSDRDLISVLLTIASDQHTNFNKTRDSCANGHSPPLYQLLGDKLSVVLIKRAALIFAGVPNSSTVSTLALLEAMAGVLNNSKHSSEAAKMSELSQFVTVNAPFGTALHFSPASLTAQPSPQTKPRVTDQQKVPGWRGQSHRGQARLTLCVKEEIQGAQYDKSTLRDTWQLSGSLLCKAEVEGSPDIQVTLTTPTDGLDDMVLHPIVHSDDSHHHGNQRRLRFSPNSESIPLVHYNVPNPPSLPIRGFYQMRGEESVRLLVQLKLNERVKNNFDYCEVHIPFFNRGVIERLDSVVPTSLTSSLSLSQDNKAVIWSIGQRFPPKTLELSLQATVYFKDHSQPAEDLPFFVGSNAYVEVFFKLSDYTLSGTTVDHKSVTLFQSTKPRVLISRELYSSSYRIWNSHGDVITTYSQQTNH